VPNLFSRSAVRFALLVGAGLGLFAPLAFAQNDPAGLMPEGPGKAETIAVCGGCHGAAMTSRRSDRLWDSLWSTMLGHGMQRPSPEVKEIVMTYLKTYLSTEREPPAAAPAAPM
jgi:hypothetical protein